MTRWLRQHLRAFGRSVRRFLRHPVAAALNVLVIGIALSLPTAGYVLVENLARAASGVAAKPQFTVFLQRDAATDAAAKIAALLEKHRGVAGFRFVPKDEALKQLRESAGLGEADPVLEKNPLPDAFVVDADALDPDQLDRLRDQMAAWPAVDHVQLDSAWARRLDALLRVGQLAVLVVAALLGTALVLVTFNTIRLQILTQRDEIEVAKLIGATDGFIRRPFLYYGSLLGLAGGAAGWIIVAIALVLLNAPVGRLAELYGARFALSHLGALESATLLGAAGLLGWLGASLSVARHLRDVEPK
jgi:cell division transport system permease protein